MMGADRLQRCNPWAWSYLDKHYVGIENNRLIDPPENHYLKISNIQYPISKNENIVLRNDSQQPITDLSFADYLYSSQDFPRAISEYKRIYFSATDTLIDIKEYCNLMLGESYLKINEYNQALHYFSLDNTSLYQYGRARTFLQSGQIDKAREELITFDNNSLNKEKVILIGTSYFKQGNFKSGSAYLSEHRYLDDNVIEKLSSFDGRKIPRRNQTIATLLSAVIPGAGQVYSNRFGDGLYSFITVTSCGLVSSYYWKNDEKKIKFSIFSLLTAFFWAGNVYGANIAARDYNRYHFNNYQKQIDDILQDINFTPIYQYKKK